MIYGALLGSVPLGGFFSQITLTAQNMILTPIAIPCFDPCTVSVTVTWINYTAGTIPPGQTIGITVDGIVPPNGSIVTIVPINVGETVTYTFNIAGLIHTNTNLICPVPN